MKILKAVLLALSLAIVAMASSADEILPRVEGTWKVVGYEFGRISALDDNGARAYVGKTLVQERGWLESPFGSCKLCGLTLDYTKHTAKELIQEDVDYSALKFPNGYALVHELTWANGQGITMIQVDMKTAYVPLDGVFFILKRQAN